MTHQRGKVLVLGEDTRSFLSVIRSLGQSGYTVDVICYDRLSPSLKSKYIRQAYHFNYQAYTSEQWLEQLIKLAQAELYQAIVPCDERAIFPLYENRQHFPDDTALAIPNDEVIAHLFDKYTTKALAKRVGVRHAPGRLMSLQAIQYKELLAEFGDQFVIKPTLSFKSDALSKRQKVEIINSEANYIAWQQQFNLNDEYLVESYFAGTGEGISVLALEGKILAFFAHTRVHEPKTGGGSSYRKSIKLDKGMAEACVKLCQATNYTGVGMFEFKKNSQTGDWILIEVNARFWGSLPLAIYAGVDFPTLYVDALLSKQNQTKQTLVAALPDQQHYKVGVYARSLTNDIFDIKKELEVNLAQGSKAHALFSLFTRLLSFSRILIGKERIDSYMRADVTPFKNEVSQFYKNILAPKLPWYKHPLQTEQMAELIACLQNATKAEIKIICYGNIMRSPFAHRFLQVLIDELELDWRVDSFGFHLNENRESPTECLDVAKRFGINLASHRSKWLRQEHIHEDDILIIFDELNKDKLDRFYQAKHVFNLADFVPQHLGTYQNIDDPYKTGEQGVQRCYELISEALKNILKHFKAAAQ
ncbi:ATP-grasp domain-containing protein [Arsukibacterium sp.]|uniref:arsenate reductase/protein-tyrosine-phosphatase family protein n=1 Tax=Arsukibacterium sp. TaxID=1977258 RepID=UPI00356A411E